MKHRVGGFRIHPEIKFVPRRVDEFRIVGGGIQAAAHEDEFLCEFGELRIDAQGEREVGHRAALVDGDLVRIFVHHANQKVRSVFGGRLRGGLAFFRRRDDEGIVIPAAVPGAGVTGFAVALLPELRLFARADKREDRAGNNGDVAAAHHFKKPQGVDNFFVAPLIAGDNGDAKNFNLRRLNERGKRLHVAAAGPGAVLVDDDLAASLSGGVGNGEDKSEKHRAEKKTTHGFRRGSGRKVQGIGFQVAP